MKKIVISCLAAAGLVFALSSCGEEKKNVPSQTAGSTISTESEAASEANNEMAPEEETTPSPISGDSNEQESFENPDASSELPPGTAATDFGTALTHSLLKDAPSVDPYEQFRGEEVAGLYSFPDFYELGWSEDGKFMWGTSVINDGRGGYDIKVCVQDLVSDEILWSKFIAFDEDNNFSSYASSAFDAAMQDNDKELKGIVEKYKIVPCHTGFFAKNNSFTFKTKQADKGTDDFGFPKIDYSISATSIASSKSKELTSEKDSSAFTVRVAGAIPSPFENRIAVVIAKQVWVFEGSGIEYSITGCHTKVGF